MKLIKMSQVIEMTSLANSTIYKYIKEGTFPKPVKLTVKKSAWVEEEIESWILTKIQEREA